MRRGTNYLFLTLMVLLVFTMFATHNSASSSEAQAQEEIRTAIDAIIKDAEDANLDGLASSHLNSTKFSKFGPRKFERQDLESTNASEAAFFGSIANYKQEVHDLKVDVFGDIAIATYYPHVSFERDGEQVAVTGRQTFVFIRTNDGWKLVHEHGTVKH